MKESSEHEYSYDKVTIAMAIFLLSLLSAFAPLKLIQTNQQFFSVGNMLAAGILLSAGLVHQLPDSRKSMSHLTENHCQDDVDTMTPEFIAGLTFLAFLIMEEVIHLVLETSHHAHNVLLNGQHAQVDNTSTHHDDHSDEEAENDRRSSSVATIHTHTHSLSSPLHSTCGGQYHVYGTPVTMPMTTSDPSPIRNNHHEHPAGERQSLLYKHDRHHSLASSTNVDPSMTENSHSHNHHHHHHHHHHGGHIDQHLHGSFVASIVLLIALSIHSVLEGMAIGVSTDTTSIISTTLAIILHKAFAGFALGSSLVAATTNITTTKDVTSACHNKDNHYCPSPAHRRRILTSILFFSLCTPTGVVMGVLLESPTNASSISTGIVQAMVAGTFLYIAIVEIAMKEVLACRQPTDGCSKTVESRKLVALCVGYLAMSALALVV